jgi:hypothetical protein
MSRFASDCLTPAELTNKFGEIGAQAQQPGLRVGLPGE